MVRALKGVTDVATLATTPLMRHIVDEDGDEITLEEAFGASLAEIMQQAVARPRRRSPCGAHSWVSTCRSHLRLGDRRGQPAWRLLKGLLCWAERRPLPRGGAGRWSRRCLQWRSGDGA
jgi:hypothetical protein